ncbi:MAG: hypothetical protein CBC38_00540 [Gammaproteobacteria bacterium TMED78]|nr:MAG: hypothetical protein CBC38_00540 [Gammaproteobacteria bacterium TMED78]|tara:strand:+ start:91 stop:1092 length:1002 start_codon:yes stop_codon:yes gene_type:complete
MLRYKNFLSLFFISTLLTVLLVAFISLWEVITPHNLVDQVIIIEPGASFIQVADELKDMGVINSPFILTSYKKFFRPKSFIKSGEYLINSNDSPISIVDNLFEGRVLFHQFTIIEGWTFTQLLNNLRSHSVVNATNMTDSEIIDRLGINLDSLEGQFLAETYNFVRGDSDIDILTNAHNLLKDTLNEAWKIGKNNVLNDPYQALVLASIIEKETALSDERYIISGVFTKRLEKKMRLQSDPTVIYGLGNNFSGDITKDDLNDLNEYNTYRIDGLPPTPICLVGKDSILSAVFPDNNNYLYFVATGNSDGKHFFSSSLADHNRAVEKYLSNIKY